MVVKQLLGLVIHVLVHGGEHLGDGDGGILMLDALLVTRVAANRDKLLFDILRAVFLPIVELSARRIGIFGVGISTDARQHP